MNKGPKRCKHKNKAKMKKRIYFFLYGLNDPFDFHLYLNIDMYYEKLPFL